MNVADSDFIAGYFDSNGYSACENPEDADVIVVNTCTVRQHAEDRALSFIGTLKKIKAKNKNLRIIVAGCVAERLKCELKNRFPYVDLLLGAKDMDDFRKHLSEFFNSNDEYGGISSGRSDFVTISRGCSNYCSYCIVPYVRGEVRHLPVKDIIYEVKKKADSGIDRVVLLGQNVNSYEYDGCDFAELLEEVCGIEKIRSVGFLTNHPKDMSDKIIKVVAENPKIEKHFHLPLQSGSDRILKLMNRGYTKDSYKNLVDKIRVAIPSAEISTDIIVGFPMETEEDFAETLLMIKDIGYSNIFGFKYSVREQTSASGLEDSVHLSEKEKRLSEVLRLQKSLKITE